MQDKYKIQHVIKIKIDRANPYESITHIGGTRKDGAKWEMTQQDAIIGLTSGKWSFCVAHSGKVVDVIVATSPYGHKYLKTIVDNDHPETLLKLPEAGSSTNQGK